MVKKVQTGDEYKVMHETSTAKKIANIFTVLWILGITAPVCYTIFTKADSIKEFVIVKTVYEANKTLMKQYTDLSNNLVSKININKYTSKIKVPEIKLDNLTDKTEKVNKTANMLSKFGVKEADKVADTSSKLQAQVDKVNKEIKDSAQNITKTLEADITKALKDELNDFASNQMQKQLNLSQTNYKNLTSDKYGILTVSQRNITHSIYSEFSKSNLPMVKNVISSINTYYKWISFGILGIAFIITLLPVFIAFKIAKIFTKNFNKCPYCGKVYFSKSGKFGILSFLKFWK